MLLREKMKVEPYGDIREIKIYLPDSYDYSDKSYPVLYIMDGQNAFVDAEAFAGKSWGFREYVEDTRMGVIMVAIPCNQALFEREKEYSPWNMSKQDTFLETGIEDFVLEGYGDDFILWIIKKLKPEIDACFRTIKDDTAIVGSSMGGVIASYATLKYPKVFPKCACLSTAFWFYEKEFKKLISHADLSSVKCFYFDIGSDEGCGSDLANKRYRKSNAHILMHLQPKIENLHFRYVGKQSHNEWAWAKRVDNFMSLFYEKGSDENVSYRY